MSTLASVLALSFTEWVVGLLLAIALVVAVVVWYAYWSGDPPEV